jgi:hypothetical protein
LFKSKKHKSECLIISSFFKISSSRSHMSTHNDTMYNKEINMMNVERNLQEWNIPSIPTKNIWKQSTFSSLSFLSDYNIKTVEKTISLNNEYESIKLFNREAMERHRQKYSFMHIGLVQVVVKPLTS